MSLRPSVRFAIFERDSFTCRYCNRSVSDGAVLEVDHVVPRSAGGSDDPANLATACWDCNRGKAARIIGQHPDGPALDEITERMAEHELQVAAYNVAQAAQRARIAVDLRAFYKEWDDVWGGGPYPWESVLTAYITKLGLTDTIDAIWITAERRTRNNQGTTMYYVGVLKRKLAEREGRLKLCTLCKRWIILDEDQDASLEYMHANCSETSEK